MSRSSTRSPVAAFILVAGCTKIIGLPSLDPPPSGADAGSLDAATGGDAHTDSTVPADAGTDGIAPSTDAAPDVPVLPIDGGDATVSPHPVDGSVDAPTDVSIDGPVDAPADVAIVCTNTCDAGAVVAACGGGALTCSSVSGCTAWTSTSVCGSGLVCERSSGPGCGDPTWAEWPLPTAADELEVIDGDGGAGAASGIHLANYRDNGDGTVTDTVTALMWQTTDDRVPYSNADAIAHCAQLSLAGHSDWRLPAFTELLSIVDFGRTSPAINPVFVGTASDWYWSSGQVQGSLNMGWEVQFSDGSVTAGDTGGRNYARCVR